VSFAIVAGSGSSSWRLEGGGTEGEQTRRGGDFVRKKKKGRSTRGPRETTPRQRKLFEVRTDSDAAMETEFFIFILPTNF